MDICPDVLYSSLHDDLGHIIAGFDTPQQFLSRCYVSPPDASISQVAAASLLNAILKKNFDQCDELAEQRALDKFLQSNEICENWSIDTETLDSIDAEILGELAVVIDESLSPGPLTSNKFNLDDIFLNGDIGPGSSVRASGTSFYHKLANGAMSTTSESLYSLYKLYTSKFPLENSVEKHRSLQWGNCLVVEGSAIAFAEKNSSIKRIICTEPLLNMFFQKGLCSCLETVLLSSFGISLKTQPALNKDLACLGSITGEVGTIDLVSASDRNSKQMIAEFFPERFVRLLGRFRSPKAKLPKGGYIDMHMISSMGNAFTFPLQTLLFASVVKAVYKVLNIPFIRPSMVNPTFGVFGDDIVVKAEAYNRVCRTLEILGHEVNRDKSFNSGCFRESCGGDYVSGVNVRGIYCKSLRTPQNIYTLINRLTVWSSNHDIPLPKTQMLLRGQVWYIPVPPWESEVAGIWTSFKTLTSGRFLEQSFAPDTDPPSIDPNGSVLYTRYVALPLEIDLRNVGSRPFVLDPRKRPKNHRPIVGYNHNHDGILLAAVGSRLRDGKLGLRSLTPRFVRRASIAPCWDYIDPRHPRFSVDGWRRWVTTYEHSPKSVTFESPINQTKVWSNWLPGCHLL